MFTLMPALPAYTVGVVATGKITKEDYETVLRPALEKVSAEGWKGINMLLIVETELDNFSLSAWLEDVKLNTDYYLKWNKVAIVTDASLLKNITSAAGMIMIGETKNFALDELEKAKKWVSKP